jgi:ABC-2 type transport system permease protein
VLFTMVLPVFFFLLFGLNSDYANQPVPGRQRVRFRADQPGPVRRGAGHHQRRAMVAIERSRRLEPAAADHPAQPGGLRGGQDADRDGARAQLADRGLRGRRVTGKPDMPVWVWVTSALSVWLGSLVFAAFGLFMGYLLPTENVMQCSASCW